MERYVPKHKRKIFYVYEHWRPDINVCFWVGKGQGRRAYLFKRNRYYDRIVNKLKLLQLELEVRIVASELTEKSAFALEQKRIAFWRGLGVQLANQTVGGEGSVGYVLNATQLERLRIAQLNRPPTSEEARANMKVAQQRWRATQPTRPETRKRTSESIKAWHAKRRALKIAYSKRKPITKPNKYPKGRRSRVPTISLYSLAFALT